ncbi:hypothetical protein FI667_g12138, partial [Globisporangium splendens]
MEDSGGTIHDIGWDQVFAALSPSWSSQWWTNAMRYVPSFTAACVQNGEWVSRAREYLIRRFLAAFVATCGAFSSFCAFSLLAAPRAPPTQRFTRKTEKNGWEEREKGEKTTGLGYGCPRKETPPKDKMRAENEELIRGFMRFFGT